MSDSDNDVNIDERDDVDPESHLRLVKAINALDKTQYILKPSRDGQSDTKSEFHVSKRKTTRNAVAVTDIIKILQGSAEHAETGQKLKTIQKNNKTLRKPLEKHEAAVIKRSTGFEEVKTKLGRWDAVVSRNRTLEHQRFPLENTSLKQPVTKEYLSKFTLKSELENELDELKPVEEDKMEETFPMTMSELLEHRKEAAQLRAKQSYKEAKARRQSKIKSKKFHRIQRKEKIKQQLKDFEGLQKSDPEEALRKLEQLEKTRAQERVTLRHKSTGQWAKNKLVRAKYDKETRQELAEQLAISRELTQKTQLDESESEEETEEVPVLAGDANNPWLSKVVTPSNNEVADFVSGYKKYWDTRNAVQSTNKSNEINEKDEEDQVAPNISQEVLSASNIIEESKKTHAEGIKLTSKSKKRKLQQIAAKSTVDWDVEPIIPNKKKDNNETEILTVDNIFDDLEYKLQTTVSSKLELLKSDKKTPKNKNPEKKQKTSEDRNGIPINEFKKKLIRPEIDEELNETADITDSTEKNLHKTADSNHLNIPASDPNKVDNMNKIDPDKFVAIKPRHLQTALPDMDMEGDHLDDEENLKRITIAEAFEDDDIVAEFQQDKDSDIKKNLPQIEDLSLPGWGSWVGKGMKSKRPKRFIFNAPKVLPRKDDKKDNVIINESKDSRIKVHQVSELPFPFTSVSEFESTLRAPIGNTFIPETAHKKLTKPAVIVKTGIIIEPMDESQLVEIKKGTNTLRLIKGNKYSSKNNKGKNHSKNKNVLRMKNGKSTLPAKLK